MLNCKLAENRDGEVDLHGTAVPESVHENDREEREWDLELTQQMRAWSERREGDRRQRTRRRRIALLLAVEDGDTETETKRRSRRRWTGRRGRSDWRQR
jgi:hypothetical protein